MAFPPDPVDVRIPPPNRQELEFEKRMDECRQLCDQFDRAAWQLVRYHGATLDGLREQLEEAVRDA